MRRFKIIAAVLLAVLALLVVAQNTEVVTVRFLAWQLEMSQVVLLPGLLLLGLLAGLLVGGLLFRRGKGQ